MPQIDCYPKDKLDPSTVNFSQFSKAFVSVSGTLLGLPLFLYLLYKGSKIVDAKKGTIKWNCKTARELDGVSLEGWIKQNGIFNATFTREFFYLLETCTVVLECCAHCDSHGCGCARNNRSRLENSVCTTVCGSCLHQV